MPYPSPPEIQTSYTAQEQALGNGSFPGQEVDVDLASIRASITAIVEFLKLALRSDGKLNNGAVTKDSLSSGLIIGLDTPTPWATGTVYGDTSLVFQGFGLYLCLVPHTSTVFATDLASGRWQLVLDLTPPGGALIASNNLSDLPSKSAARTNLQLGTMATVDSGTGAAQFRTNLQNEAFFQPLAAPLTSWAALTRASGFDTFVTTPSSANLRALLTDESGAGALLFAGGAMGTPSSIDLTNATGLPFAGLAAAAVTTSSETIAANNSDTQVPTSAAVAAYASRLPGYGTPQATTSGATFDFNSVVPSWATEVKIYFKGVSLSGTDNYLFRIGPAAGLLTSGYVSNSGTTDAGAVGSSNSTSGFVMIAGTAADGVSGYVTLQKGSDNFWYFSGTWARGTSKTSYGGGYVDVGGALDKIRIMTTGANTFDAGEVNISWR